MNPRPTRGILFRPARGARPAGLPPPQGPAPRGAGRIRPGGADRRGLNTGRYVVVRRTFQNDAQIIRAAGDDRPSTKNRAIIGDMNMHTSINAGTAGQLPGYGAGEAGKAGDFIAGSGIYK